MFASKPIEPQREVFMIRVVYKSGYVHDFPVYNFKINGAQYSWEYADVNNKPLQIGVDEIAAVWQIGVK